MRAGKALRLAIWLAVLTLCALIIARARFVTDLSAFLPQSPTPAQQVLVEQLRDGVISRLVLVGISGGDASRLAAVNKELAARLRRDQRFAAVSNGEPVSREVDAAFVFRHRYLLSPGVEMGAFDATHLHTAFDEMLSLLTSDAALVGKQWLFADPTGEALRLVDELSGGAAPVSHDGAWASRDGVYSLMLIHTGAPGYDIDAQEDAQRALRVVFDAIESARGLRLDLAGPAVFSVATRATIKSDAERFAMIAGVAVALMLWLILRSPRLLVLGLLPVVSGVLVAVAAVALAFGSVHGITLGFGATLIGEAVDYAIYLFLQTSGGGEGAMRRLWPTLRLGVLTSICGFAALCLGQFPGLAQLGVFSIAGLIAAVLVTRYVLPDLMPHAHTVHGIERLGEWVVRRFANLRALRPWLALASGVCIAVILAQGGALWRDELSMLSPVPLSVQQLDTRLRAEMGAPDVRHLVAVSAPDEQSLLERCEAVSTKLVLLQEHGVIGGYDAPTKYLPSQRTQRTRQASLPTPSRLQADLTEAAAARGIAPEALAAFAQQVERARTSALLTRADMQGTHFLLRHESLLSHQHGRWFGMLPLTQVRDSSELAQALSPVASEDVVLLDLKSATDALYRGYREEALWLCALGVAAILLVLSLSLRRVTRALNVCAPIAMALAICLAGLVWVGQPLTLFHLVGMLLVVAVGSNYALFFERGLDADGAAPRTAVSLLAANLSTVLGFGVLAFSRVPVLSAIGVVVGVGAVLSLVCAAALSKPRMRESS